MVEATYVLFVRKSRRAKLRSLLQAEGGEALKWRERRRLFRSEFYLTGPAAIARQTHAKVTQLLALES